MSNPFYAKIQEIGEELGWGDDEQAQILGRALNILVKIGKVFADDITSAIDQAVIEEHNYHQRFFGKRQLASITTP